MAWVEEEEEKESGWRKGGKREMEGKVKATRIRDGAALTQSGSVEQGSACGSGRHASLLHANSPTRGSERRRKKEAETLKPSRPSSPTRDWAPVDRSPPP